MSRRRRSQTRQRPGPRPRKPWWRRPLPWIGSVATALVVAIVTALGTGIGQHLWSLAFGHRTPVGPAVRINQEIRNPPISYDYDTTQAWVLPSILNPTSTAAKVLVPKGTASGYETYDSYIDRFDSWLFSHGGATVGTTYLRITLTGGQQPILIQSICAHIISRSKILSGTLFYKPPQGMATTETTLNLDSAEPCANYFRGHYLSLSPGKSEVLDMAVIAHADTVQWNLFLDAIVNGKQEFIPVDNHEAFRTTGLLSKLTRYGVYYEYTTGARSELFRPIILGPGDEQSIKQALSPP